VLDVTTARERRELHDRQQDRTRQMAALAYLIWREWWRPFRNRARRRELQELWQAEEADYHGSLPKAGT
jgi:hypothetical protein